MTWILLEGLDRAGKSTVAELYKEQGYEVVHMSAPDKKYKQSGYSGPTYLDDILDLIMSYDGKDVVWDRTWMGEAVWPAVYGREPLLTEDDIEIIQEFEDRNQVSRILMIDPDLSAHWKRCVDNKEPLNNAQFRIASTLYTKMAHKYNFVPKQLSDFNVKTKNTKTETSLDQQTRNDDPKTLEDRSPLLEGEDKTTVHPPNASSNKLLEISGIDRLEKANAISAVLSKRIIKQRGDAFDTIEGEVTNFLKGRLEELLGGNKKQSASLSDSEIQILKLLAQRFSEKDKTVPVSQEPKQRR